MNKMRRFAVLPIAMLVLVGCQGDETGGSPSGGGGETACDSASGENLLATICEEGTIQVSTDPDYAPQSFINDNGDLDGFDIDVAKEIAARLGVEVEFITPDFAAVVAGNWSGRWDISVGSVTVTEERTEILDFTQPYYFTPAQMGATEESGITSLDELVGEVVCVGEETTYQFWLEGDLNLGPGGEIVTEAPAGIEVTTLPTDANCAESVQAGRTDFAGFLTASETLRQAIEAEIPFVEVGEPVFFEPLAVALDKSEADHAELLAEIDRIVGEMHDDGTLTELSEKWYDGQDLTKAG